MSQAIRREQQWEFQTAWGVTIHIPCDSIAIWHPGKGVQKPNQNRIVEAKNRESNRTVVIAINREFDSSLHHYNLDRQRPSRIHFVDLDLISFFAKRKMLFVVFLSIIPPRPPPLYPTPFQFTINQWALHATDCDCVGSERWHVDYMIFLLKIVYFISTFFYIQFH